MWYLVKKFLVKAKKRASIYSPLFKHMANSFAAAINKLGLTTTVGLKPILMITEDFVTVVMRKYKGVHYML